MRWSASACCALFGEPLRNHVISHIKDVLNSFASKPQYTRFYIGITGNLAQRHAAHAVKKPEFSLMCVIYEEDHTGSVRQVHWQLPITAHQLRAAARGIGLDHRSGQHWVRRL